MSLKDRITDDMKTAMRAKDSERLGTIRLLPAALKQSAISDRGTGRGAKSRPRPGRLTAETEPCAPRRGRTLNQHQAPCQLP